MKVHWLLLLCLAVVGCAPPYIEELDSAAAATRQMVLVTSLNPLTTLDNRVTGTRFLPAKPGAAATIDTLSIQSGFLVTDRPGEEDLTFIYDSGGSLQTSSSYSFSLAGADPNYPLYQYEVIASTAFGNLLVFHLDGISAGNNTVQLFTASLPGGPLQSEPSLTTNPQFLTDLWGGVAAFAADVLPLSSAADKFNMLFSSWPNYQDGTAVLASTPTVLAFGTTAPVNVALPGAGNRLLYYQNQSGSLSYASYNVSGQWVCYRWDIAAYSPLPLPGVNARIDAVLTTGELLSTQGGRLRIYDYNGSTEATVPSGALQFCYEAYVGGMPYVFFSLSLKLSQGDWVFRVYAIPTTSLRSLHG